MTHIFPTIIIRGEAYIFAAVQFQVECHLLLCASCNGLALAKSNDILID